MGTRESSMTRRTTSFATKPSPEERSRSFTAVVGRTRVGRRACGSCVTLREWHPLGGKARGAWCHLGGHHRSLGLCSVGNTGSDASVALVDHGHGPPCYRPPPEGGARRYRSSSLTVTRPARIVSPRRRIVGTFGATDE